MNIKILKDANLIAEEVSNEIIDLVKAKPNCILGLATGSTPIKTYEKIIEKSKKDNVSFKDVKSFNLDEYCNNPDETQSYRYFMNEHLFSSIDINKDNTHFPDEHNPLQYDIDIKNAGGIDIQLLGIGRDGHIGFNEPNTPLDSHTHITELDERTIMDNARFFKSIDEVPTSAVTMGIDTIHHSKKIIMIITGDNKKEIAHDLINSKAFNIQNPSTSLITHPNTTIYLDEAAAQLVKRKKLVH